LEKLRYITSPCGLALQDKTLDQPRHAVTSTPLVTALLLCRALPLIGSLQCSQRCAIVQLTRRCVTRDVACVKQPAFRSRSEGRLLVLGMAILWPLFGPVLCNKLVVLSCSKMPLPAWCRSRHQNQQAWAASNTNRNPEEEYFTMAGSSMKAVRAKPGTSTRVLLPAGECLADHGASRGANLRAARDKLQQEGGGGGGRALARPLGGALLRLALVSLQKKTR
jgi:hypothetical protein